MQNNNKTIIVGVVFALVFFFLLTSENVYAADAGLGCGGGFGPIAKFFCDNPTATNAEVGGRLNSAISSIIGFLTVMASLWFFFKLLMAGYSWMNARGDSEKTTEAWHQITNALIGLVIVVAAWVIIGLIGNLIGLDILNPGGVLGNLTI